MIWNSRTNGLIGFCRTSLDSIVLYGALPNGPENRVQSFGLSKVIRTKWPIKSLPLGCMKRNEDFEEIGVVVM